MNWSKIIIVILSQLNFLAILVFKRSRVTFFMNVPKARCLFRYVLILLCLVYVHATNNVTK